MDLEGHAVDLNVPNPNSSTLRTSVMEGRTLPLVAYTQE